MKRTAFLAIALLAAATATHAGKPHKEHAGQAPASQASDEPLLKVTFSTSETQAIRSYYQHDGGRQKQLPPGLQKKAARGKELPPGWQKKLARGEVMPLDLYRAAQPVPVTLVRQLPPPPPGTVVVHLEGKIVRLVQATREIIDILEL